MIGSIHGSAPPHAHGSKPQRKKASAPQQAFMPTRKPARKKKTTGLFAQLKSFAKMAAIAVAAGSLLFLKRGALRLGKWLRKLLPIKSRVKKKAPMPRASAPRSTLREVQQETVVVRKSAQTASSAPPHPPRPTFAGHPPVMEEVAETVRTQTIRTVEQTMEQHVEKAAASASEHVAAKPTLLGRLKQVVRKVIPPQSLAGRVLKGIASAFRKFRNLIS